MNKTITHANQTLRLDGLLISSVLGILPQEIHKPQPIKVSAELNLGAQPILPAHDDIQNVLDYRLARETIIKTCTEEGRVNLLESLVGQVAIRLLELPGVIGTRVCITKLEIFDDCEVSIQSEAGQW